MAVSVGELQVLLSGDTRKLNQDLDRLDARAGKTEQAHAGAWKRIAVTAGAAIAALGAADFFRDSITAASDLNETLNKSNVIFGQNAGQVEQWAQGSAKNFGLSKQAALEAASGFGNMLQQLGFASDEAVSASTGVVKLAADLGSFNNLDTGDVLDRIGAAMRGEYDSLQLLIPNINAARVEQEAMAETGKKNKDALTAQEKAAATLAIVQKDGAAAANDFAETSDGLANSTKITAAQFEDLKAQIGQAFLPVATGAMHFVSGTAIPALRGLFDTTGDVARGFADLPAPVQTTVVALGAVAALKGPVGSAFETIALRAMYARDAFATASEGVGVFRAAGAGLASFFGGPVGLALVATAGSFALLSSATEENEKVTSHAKDAQRGLADALRESKGAIDENVRSSAAKALQDADLLDIAEKAGVSLPRMTDAILGNKAAYNEVSAALENYKNNRLIASGYEEHGETTMHNQAAAAEQAVADFDILAGTLGHTAEQQSQLAAATEQAAAATGAALDPVAAFEAELEATAKAADEAKKETDAFKLSLDILTGANVSMIEVQAALEAALDAGKDAMDDMGGSVLTNAGALNLQSENGRTASDVLLGVKDSGNQLIAQMIAQKATTEQVQAADAKLREDFINTAGQMGINRKAAEVLAEQILGIPADRHTQITADTEQARHAIENLQTQINNLRGRTVDIVARAIMPDLNGAVSGTGRMGTFASGGLMPANRLALVGEEGPELLFPSRQAFVATAKQTAAMMAAAGNGRAAAMLPPSISGSTAGGARGSGTSAYGGSGQAPTIINRYYELKATVREAITLPQFIQLQREADALYG